MMAAFVGQQQAVALLVETQADHVDRHQGLEGGGGVGADQAQLAHVRDVEQAGGIARVGRCSAIRPAGYCTGIA